MVMKKKPNKKNKKRNWGKFKMFSPIVIVFVLTIILVHIASNLLSGPINTIGKKGIYNIFIETINGKDN